MAITDEILDQLLSDCHTPEDITGEHGIIKVLTKAIIERAVKGELSHHLGYAKHDPQGHHSGNSRNGSSPKPLIGDFGALRLNVPRDRNGSFEPLMVSKHQRRWEGFDEKIITMYALGLTSRQMSEQLRELYGVEVSAGLISQVTDSVMDEVRTWQQRALDPIYPIVYLDALVVKVHHEGHVVNKSVYLAIGVNLEGRKELLGIWMGTSEGAKFWLSVITELQSRGVKDIFVCCIDGLKGFPDAVRSVFPATEIQLCIVHMVRNSLKYVSHKDRKQLVAAMRAIYRAATAEDAAHALDEFETAWASRYPLSVTPWREHWAELSTFFAYPQEIRRAIYTTNVIESVNSSPRRVIGRRPHFPSDDAVYKLLFLSIQRIAKRWTMPIPHWAEALNQFSILFPKRLSSNSSN